MQNRELTIGLEYRLEANFPYSGLFVSREGRRLATFQSGDPRADFGAVQRWIAESAPGIRARYSRGFLDFAKARAGEHGFIPDGDVGLDRIVSKAFGRLETMEAHG